MIPLRLQLRNFMCYAEGTLLLDGVHVACLSGDNGHGKSALLDALTWALWGKARARGDDELIQLGKIDMEVELEFAVAGSRYRVIRKRALRGRRGTTALEFQVRGDDGYRPIGAESVQETQRKIVATLRMEYDTFINSALLLQGRADEFTVKSPAERKKVLADVLGLARYDELEGRAREQGRAAEQARRTLVVELDEIERQLAPKPEYRARRDQLALDLESLARELAGREAALRLAREAKHALDNRRQRLDELRGRHQRERQQLEGLERQARADGEALRANEDVLAGKKELEAGYRRLLAVRERLEELAQQAACLLGLDRQRAEAEQSIATARSGLEAELRVEQANLAALQKKAGARPTISDQMARLEQRLAALGALEAERETLRETARGQRFELEALKTRNARLKDEMAELKQKIALLGGDGATCPVCGTALGAAGRARLSETLRAQGGALGDEYRENAARAGELGAAIASAQRESATLDAQLGERDKLRGQVGGLERAVAEAAQAALDAEQVGVRVDALRDRIQREDFAADRRRDLAELRAQIAALGYEQGEHERLRREARELAPAAERWAQVEKAATAAALLRDKVRQGEQLIARQRETLAELARESDELAGEVARSSRVLKELAEAEEAVDRLGRSVAELRVQLGRAEQMLSHCAFLEQQRGEKSAALRQATEEKAIYDELALAFGKKGIQAMIIDGVLPEIEDEANALLARMTDGRMNVKLETQREAKTADMVIETLDIKIADELGYRQYELYSGGEAFRVNFALRIALSKLLARRAGARLQTLIVDEGFGTQDAFGRERLVEAINVVSEEFDRILVITHIPELKDAFPVRIDVLKTAAGSQIVVNG